MAKTHFFFTLFLLKSAVAATQIIPTTVTPVPFKKQAYSDAVFAIPIEDSIYGPTNVGEGSGKTREYEGRTFTVNARYNFVGGEEHSAWFRLEFDHDTLLTFDLVPIDVSDDYDFIFFKCADSVCVEKLNYGRLPDRECHSGFESFNGATGMSKHASSSMVGAGPGPTYVSALRVKKGEVYYLAVLYPGQYVVTGKIPRGFTLYFHDYWPKKKPRVLKNVNFKSNDATLLPESFAELDKLAEMLNKDKTMHIEVKGHADDQGSEEKNKDLSSRRAKAVKDYLVSKGIDPKRIMPRGYGSSKPLVSNATEGGRKKNRRVEFAPIMR